MLGLAFLLPAFLAPLAAIAGDIRAITPHDMYSSSVGVLGCKIDTNRVAYWPMSVDCDNICVRVSYGSRSVELLRVDQSQGAHDISYDAWNYLMTGQSAVFNPVAGGAVDMEVETVPAENCRRLIHSDGGRLPLSASNSMNFVASCLARPDSWVARNMRTYNIQDPVCHWGHDEECGVDLAVSNQPSCPHQLGTNPGNMLPHTVFNIEYTTGRRVAAP